MNRHDKRTNPPNDRAKKLYEDPRKEFDEKLKSSFGNNYIELILSEGKEDYNGYIDKVEEYVKSRLKNISTSQLRNIFSAVKDKKTAKELWLLRPKLAYIAGKENKPEMKELVYLLDQLLKKVEDNNIKQFSDFFESIIAYHKYFSPKSN